MKSRAKLKTIVLVAILCLTNLPFLLIPTATSDLINPSVLQWHSPIIINGNSQFNSTNGVVAGDGTENNPYIIENWSIEAYNATGIWIEYNDAYFIIRNCYIYNGNKNIEKLNGIYLRNTENGIIENCRIENNEIGIYIYYSWDIEIINSTFSYNRNAIRMVYSNFNNISDNIISNNIDTCIFTRSSNYNRIIRNNFFSFPYGIHLGYESNHNLVQGNNCSNAIVGIGASVYGKNNTFIENICNNNTEHGIYCWIQENCTISNNTCISGNETGILIRGSNYCIISNNICSLNGNRTEYYYDQNGIRLSGSHHNQIFNNICNENMGNGIIIMQTSLNNTVRNNYCNQNYDSGISINQGSNNNLIFNNTCKKNNYIGIRQWQSENNIIENNILHNNRGDGIEFWLSRKTIVKNNDMVAGGIFIYSGSKEYWNSYTLGYNDYLKEYWNTFTIDNKNTVNNKPLYYLKNKNNESVPLGAGEIILANCSNITISNQNLSDGSVGILSGFSNSNVIENTICNNNIHDGILLFNSHFNSIDKTNCNSNKGLDTLNRFDDYDKGSGINLEHSYLTTIKNCNFNSNNNSGIFLFESNKNLISNSNCLKSIIGLSLNSSNNNTLIKNRIEKNENNLKLTLSSKNVFDNCTFLSSSIADVFLENTSKDNMAINSTFNTIQVDKHNSNLEIKNYLHIQVNDLMNKPLDNVDFKITDNQNIIYVTPAFNGTDPKTDTNGKINWILLTDRIYSNSKYPIENHTILYLRYKNKKEINITREVNMTTSHTEYFQLNIGKKELPDKVILNSPYNNSYINDSTPELKWYSVSDLKIDPLTYSIEVDDFQGDWTTLVVSKQTGKGIINWNISKPLSDGEYQWRVRANDGNLIGPWSDVWNFTVDTIPPEISIFINNDDEYTNSTNVILNLSALDLGSGVSQMAFSSDGVNWTDWESYINIKPYNLTIGDGEKSVYFMVSDKVNNTAIMDDVILLDTTPPYSLSIIINNGTLLTNSTSIFLNLHARDNLSGVHQMTFSPDGIHWSTWEDYNETKIFKILSGDGGKTIYFKVSDQVGNIAYPISASIILNTTLIEFKPDAEPDAKPEPEKINPLEKDKSTSTINYWFYLIIIIIVIIILIIGIVIVKRKKQSDSDLSPSIQDVMVKSSEPILPAPAQEVETMTPSSILQSPLVTTEVEVNSTSEPTVVTIPETIGGNSTPLVQVPEKQQIPQSTQVPQLPPVQTQGDTQAQVQKLDQTAVPITEPKQVQNVQPVQDNNAEPSQITQPQPQVLETPETPPQESTVLLSPVATTQQTIQPEPEQEINSTSEITESQKDDQGLKSSIKPETQKNNEDL
jgi:parallel beta-helix repeat protein